MFNDDPEGPDYSKAEPPPFWQSEEFWVTACVIACFVVFLAAAVFYA